MSTSPPVPTAVPVRAIAPDLARGAALLLIAVANAHLFLYGHEVGVRGYVPDPGTTDRVLAIVQVLLVDGRAYPLFGVLFGYGLVRLATREDGAATVRRRGRRLLLLGFAHAALLFSGDVVGPYGLIGLALGGLVVTASARRLRRAAALWLVGPALTGAALAAPGPPGQSAWLVSMTVSAPLPAAAVRVGEWAAVGLLQALGLAAAVLLGGWVAQRGLLDEPQRHRRVLTRIAAGGFAISVLGALPLALMAAAIWPDPSLAARLLAGALHGVTGYAGGLAAVALSALVATRLVSCAGNPGHESADPGGSPPGGWRADGGGGAGEEGAARSSYRVSSQGRQRREGPPGPSNNAVDFRRGAPARPGVVATALISCGQRSLSCYLAQSVVFVAVLAPYGGGLGDRAGLTGAALLAVGTWAATVLGADLLRRTGRRGPFEAWLRR